MKTETTERGLERLICTALTGHSFNPPKLGIRKRGRFAKVSEINQRINSASFVYPACPVASENGIGVAPEDLSASGRWYWGGFAVKYLILKAKTRPLPYFYRFPLTFPFNSVLFPTVTKYPLRKGPDGTPFQILLTDLLTGAIFPVGSENLHYKSIDFNLQNHTHRTVLIRLFVK